MYSTATGRHSARPFKLMGINYLLPRLPGGAGPGCKFISFYDLVPTGPVVLDATGALWQHAFHHSADFLRGNHPPSLTEWACLLVYLRSICGWKLVVYFDGRNNPHKDPENKRHQEAPESARARGESSRTVKNTPEYIAKAVCVCKFLDVEYYVSAYEADPQVSAASLSQSYLPVTGDSDILAYGPIGEEEKSGGKLQKIILVESYSGEIYRVIDLSADIEGNCPFLISIDVTAGSRFNSLQLVLVVTLQK